MNQTNERKKGHFYSLMFTPLGDEGMQVRSGGHEEIPPGGLVRREELDTDVIEYIQRGEGKVVTSDKKYPLQSGTVFYFKQQVPYRIQNHSSRSMVRYFVHFDGRGASTLLDHCSFRDQIPAQTTAAKSIQSAFEQFHRLRYVNVHTERLSELIFEQLILEISESIARSGNFGNPSFETYQKCRHHIEMQFLYLDSLNEIAANCGVAAEHLCRLFKRFDKMSPYKFLVHLKMQKAAWWFAHTDKLVKEVASELGYSNPFHFSRVFKTHHGVSPRAFSKQQRG